MTSMVVLLKISRSLGEIFQAHHHSWSVKHCCKFIDALALCFHHARCFNLDTDLRHKLSSINFMSFADNPLRSPHLIDQEIQAGTQLISFALRVFTDLSSNITADKTAKEALVKHWIGKYGSTHQIFLACHLQH